MNRTGMFLLMAALAGLLLLVVVQAADREVVQPPEAIAGSRPAPPMPTVLRTDPLMPGNIPVRHYPEQPPVVPHDVRSHQIDRYHNRCMDCHSGDGSELTGATLVSATHYVDRDGDSAGRLAGQRYFCLQCHVPQSGVPLLAPVRLGIGGMNNLSEEDGS